MSRAKMQDFPKRQLPQRYRYEVDELTINSWLSSLKINPENRHGQLYVNAEQLKLLDELHNHCKQGGTVADFVETVELDAVFDLLAQKVASETNRIRHSSRKRNKATIKDFFIEKIRMFFNYKWEASYSEKINFHSWAFLTFFMIATVIAFGITLFYKNPEGTPSNLLLIVIAIILLLVMVLFIISAIFMLWFMANDIFRNWKSSEELARDRIKEARKEALEDRAIVRELYEISTQKNLKYVELRFKSLIEKRKDSTSLDDDFLRVLVLLIVVAFYVFTSGSAVQSLLRSLLQSLKLDPLYAGLIGPFSVFSGLLIILSPFLKLPSQKVIADYKKCMSLLEQAQAVFSHTDQ